MEIFGGTSHLAGAGRQDASFRRTMLIAMMANVTAAKNAKASPTTLFWLS
jgi:hypothetical protein